MKVDRQHIIAAMTHWETAWNHHDIHGVMDLFHDEVVFEHWHGARVTGKEALRTAWTPWFRNHGNFCFTTEDLFVDDIDQKVLYRWTLEWPCLEKGFEGQWEKRRGVDVIRFQDGKIIEKLTYSKTALEIDGKRVRMAPTDG